MTDILYLRLKRNIEFSSMQEVRLKDIAYLTINSDKLQKSLGNMKIYQITQKDKEIVVIDSFLIIKYLTEMHPNLEIQLLGPEQTIIRIKKYKKSPSVLIVGFVWLLLFIGTAMTIMNFHYDVSMQEVQQKLHFLLTGEENEYPLWIQIPYSLGLGAGMLLFFNYFFKKKFNEEPSPLELEIYKYQQGIDNYVSYYENKLNNGNDPF
ncbi:stage V sporulation protein AA [Ornithinibacillus halophilus]|uniref:Stage V sporulation protein AA n=1 Tax=Ornithinibacillus halophilus TaxID=930117 RepID=A0A1M5CU38_9BACI|nr:stage V sporulation protein AA [Ornithinibacillus halophilus]SHF58234.1 stage V sporulation protein AA [Ornithinibacillus halophilus]